MKEWRIWHGRKSNLFSCIKGLPASWREVPKKFHQSTGQLQGLEENPAVTSLQYHMAMLTRRGFSFWWSHLGEMKRYRDHESGAPYMCQFNRGMQEYVHWTRTKNFWRPGMGTDKRLWYSVNFGTPHNLLLASKPNCLYIVTLFPTHKWTPSFIEKVLSDVVIFHAILCNHKQNWMQGLQAVALSSLPKNQD